MYNEKIKHTCNNCGHIIYKTRVREDYFIEEVYQCWCGIDKNNMEWNGYDINNTSHFKEECDYWIERSD